MDPETRFREVFELAYAPLCRYARHRGLTGPDAEDLVAQTMEIAGFQPARILAGWNPARCGPRWPHSATTTRKYCAWSPGTAWLPPSSPWCWAAVPTRRARGCTVRAAALIPGVTAVANATDAIGRHGVAVAMTCQGVRTEWIFSEQTLQYLGERDINIANGSTVGEAAVLQRAFVDRAGQVPG